MRPVGSPLTPTKEELSMLSVWAAGYHEQPLAEAPFCVRTTLNHGDGADPMLVVI
jgi:hypothetical protein